MSGYKEGWSLNVAMIEYPYLANVRFSVSARATPWDDYEFFTPEIDGSMIVVVNDTEEVEAGTVKLLRVQVTEAVNRGFNLFGVCDAYAESALDESVKIVGIMDVNVWELRPKTPNRLIIVLILIHDGVINTVRN